MSSQLLEHSGILEVVVSIFSSFASSCFCFGCIGFGCIGFGCFYYFFSSHLHRPQLALQYPNSIIQSSSHFPQDAYSLQEKSGVGLSTQEQT